MLLALLIPIIAACGNTQPAAETPTTEPTTETSPTDAPTDAPTDVATETATETPADAATATDTPTNGAATDEVIMLPDINPADVTGDIIAAGSSTVFPLAERMADVFGEDGYSGQITIDRIGSGAGFERFCVAGETDIANASRPIRDSEIASCQEIDREPIEFRIGTDALAVTVSIANDFLDDVTQEELAAIFATAETWADVRADWPAEPIQRFIPGTDSGTFDYFVEAIYEPLYEEAVESGQPTDIYTAEDIAVNQDDDDAVEAAITRPILEEGNPQQSEDDNVLVQGIEGSPYAIGFFGFAYYQENRDQLNILSIDGVEPNEETAESNEYPLSRPLFMYSDAAIMQEKPQIAAFLNYVLTFVNDEIIEVGYFPASVSAINDAKQKWLDATGETAVQ
ncbi:MAG: PstS family phosphate ABC transporter substrate-binding protein [Chloroflexales bacterium]|nr:PstS family phosphate ABC transporter substrate-binding protein [Chloroflexales bacterium]